jgi:hypothetical protein
MSKVSVIIPSAGEQFLEQTIRDVLLKAKGDIEVIPVCDGYRPSNEELVRDERVKYLFKGKREGMRPAISDGVAMSTGGYIYKLDGHCLMGESFDTILKADCKPHWVVIPQRRRLDAENWCEQIQANPRAKPHVDYERLSAPTDVLDFGGPGLNGRIWTERILERQGYPEYDIDKNLSFQGSSWFTTREHFDKGKLTTDLRWGTFWNEAQLISFRTTLCDYPNAQGDGIIGPGSVMTNKRTFFCHLHKGRQYGRGYKLDERELKKGRDMAMKFYWGERVWDDQKRPLSWLISQFMPLPEWDENMLDELRQRERKHGWNV